jgi:hypothetical protein
LGYPAKPDKVKDYNYQSFDLIYIDMQGQRVLSNQKEVLEAITFHKDFERYVPEGIEKGREQDINSCVEALKNYLQTQAVDIQTDEEGKKVKMMGKEARDVLAKLRKGEKSAIDRLKENKKTEEKYQLDQFDLITWFIISN